MKEYIKMTLATVTGLLLFGFISTFLSIGMVGALAAAGEGTPVMPKEAVLQIDFSSITLTEQTKEADPLAILKGGSQVTPVGIYSAINAINIAHIPPNIFRIIHIVSISYPPIVRIPLWKYPDPF